MTRKTTELALPALRGVMGDWVYYSCLMGFDEIARRINFADEIHENEKLSEMIQRRLKEGRGKEIANYIKDQNERFFNSLVVATYEGNPNWFSLGEISSENIELPNLSENTINSIGFLNLSGEEKLFAIDGQHRLAGIKKVIQSEEIQDPWDEVSVIFVAHKSNKQGKERTRRLFTTLNKTARPVSKGDIIALDEDDVMAIITRKLIEETKLFSENRIAFSPTNNMPANNLESLTTIGNLYKLLTILFTKASHKLKKGKKDLTRIRPNDEELNNYFEFAKNFFNTLGEYFPEINEFFINECYGDVTKKYRGSNGGNVLFRPIGIELFVLIIAHLMNKKIPMKEAVELAAKLPRDMSLEPFVNVIWNPNTKTMNPSQHMVVLREVLLNMLGHSKEKESQLLNKYRNATGSETVDLPAL